MVPNKLLLILLILFLGGVSFANPLILFHINEFQFDSTGWKMELINLDMVLSSLDGCYLKSLTDTSYFISGISLTDSFLIITPDSMLDNFYFNRTGDNIELYASDTWLMDVVIFNNFISGSNIVAPLSHQSICLREYNDGDGQSFYYYLDNTPTFGNTNDTLNAKGCVAGIVSDSLGNPLQGVEVVYDYFFSLGTRYDISVYTDTAGYFCLRDYARINTIKMKKPNYITEFVELQIWPEDTITICDTLYHVIDAIKNKPVHSISKYNLTQNYPNPFNSSTSFTYTLPKSDFVEINIYSLTGKLVEKLFAGEQNWGEYKIHWKAESVASGIYIYQIKTNEFINYKKCLLIK